MRISTEISALKGKISSVVFTFETSITNVKSILTNVKSILIYFKSGRRRAKWPKSRFGIKFKMQLKKLGERKLL